MAQKKMAKYTYEDHQIIKNLQKNPEGLRASTIGKLVNLRGRTLYNRLEKLEKVGLIQNIYPIWKIGKVQVSSKTWQTLLTSDTEQGHHLCFILPLIKKPDWWNKRKDKLIKLKGWHYKSEITANNNRYYSIENDSMEMQMFKNSIYFICKEKYSAPTPFEIFNKAKDDVLEAIRFLEERFRFKFIAEGNAHLTISSSHYLTIKDALSEHCKKEGERFEIESKEGYKLWVDFSEPIGTESNNPEVKRRYLKEIKDRIDNPLTPVASEIWQLSTENTRQLKKTIEIVQSNQNLIIGIPNVLNKLEQQIESHLKLIQEYRKENINWREQTKKKYKEQASQSKLDKFL